MAAFYCSVCRQTSFSGKGHIFGKSHQSRLRVVLLKFSEKVKEARRTIKKPHVEKCDFTQHQRTFWCYCCGMEVERNITDGNMTVLFGGLLEHMATAEHRKSTHKFWWENKADPKLRDRFIITQEETERFKAEVEKVLESFVEKEDEHIKQQADHIRAQEKHRLEVLQSFLKEPEKELELPNGSHSLDNSVEEGTSSHLKPTGSDEQAGPSRVDSMVESHWPGGPGQGLTFIGYQDSSNSGNVHTGAIPPWLQEDLGDGNPGMAAQQEIGPSLQDFLKQKEQEKLRKLPANRVGANFDHSSKTDANWLPSFGRVWNSGRRWQSRHQFRAEEEGQTKRQKREHGSAEGSKMPKDMSKDWGEPSERERQMLKIRRDSDTKAAELAKMEKMLQETRSLLDKKPGTESQDYQGNMVEDLEERVRCSRRQRRSSLHHTQMLESQMKTVKDELEGTLDHLQELRDKLRRSQQKAEERKVAMEKLAAGLPR